MKELKIVSEIENPLFNRKEIEATIEAEVTPSREDVKKIISEKFSADSESIKIKTIKGSFGSRNFIIVANIYKSKEEMDKIEIKKKKDIRVEKKPEEKPAEEPQASKEETKEEPAPQKEEPTEEENVDNNKQPEDDSSLTTKNKSESPGEANSSDKEEPEEEK